MKRYFIVTFKDDWADEMDFEGFKIFEEKSYREFMDAIANPNEYPLEVFFGTNESIEYETPEDMLNTLTFKEISSTNYFALGSVLPLVHDQFGQFPELV